MQALRYRSSSSGTSLQNYHTDHNRCPFFPDGISSGALPKLPLHPLRRTRDTGALPLQVRLQRVFGQWPERHRAQNPAPSPSGHPLLSGPPTLNDIHQVFTTHATPAHTYHIYHITYHLHTPRQASSLIYTLCNPSTNPDAIKKRARTATAPARGPERRGRSVR